VSSEADVDVVVIGGGIVGLATARAVLVDRPGATVVVVEKEPAIARHQTGRNSGVIHSGIYYRPGSAKARLVARGRTLLESFCADHGIHREYCGKVVVATSGSELGGLDRLARLADDHGLEVNRLDAAGLRSVEPHAAGVAALHVPATGIVDFGEVASALAEEVRQRGGEVRTGVAVESLSPGGGGPASEVVVGTNAGSIRSRRVVNCAGLHADRVARMDGRPDRDDPSITPFRGEYHELRPAARSLVRHLVYPVPDPSFPFLGVHFTRSIHGGVHAGPNAVLALAREGYTWGDISARDLAAMARDPGVWHLARRHWWTGIGEVWRSLSTAAFVRALRRLVPEIGPDDLEPAPAGVRAQALRRDGTLVDDFAFVERGSILHVLNAPSPAATASLAIGEHVASRLA
jgi:L-2-hydroxyglutarate oxidase